ncbi:hypothetical protein [Winogradskyella sp. UBA3174]|uniref:hypothetical protein n=1 Tax=Winogradskyella sp. UBA3174 TaxID=1947785 RepID=UPI0025DA6640|nr:hypothetical protein [Winogradskyella sp. UBA3174]|tara:strand:+ start:49 stop:837 length:789 start_codon:yes stop_codon:yes gene_type:complete
MEHLKKIIVLLISLIALSCSKNDDDNIGSIETDINFMPVEIYNNSNISENPGLKLKLITRKEFPCDNYSIITTQSIEGNELIIRFEEISVPTTCLTAIGPAISYIDLPEKINEITFINGNTIDKYSISINEEKILINIIDNNFTHLLFNQTFRYPHNSFAYVSGTNTDNTEIYDQFLEVLKENPNFTEFDFEGEGRIPYPTSSDGHWVNQPSKYFKYTDYEEFENLKSILENFSRENIEENSGVSISIYGWDNISYHSWLSN